MTCHIPGGWWTYPASLPHTLQLVGLLFVAFGLGRTWWQWSDDPVRHRVGQWFRRLRRRDAVIHAAGGVAVASGVVAGLAQTTPSRPVEGDSLDAVLSYVEKLVANADERRQADTAAASQALSQAEHRWKSRDMDLSNRVDAVAAAQEQTAKTLALDGLVIAALGVVGSSLGLLLSWPGWCV